ncbi:MAG TPA: class I SAM-dependent rRNA methyltransferase, partial [Ilumatobacteraceae bacterium]|nr:class I SAM-dependent rRNA methyltransferase [Ilumatobacteraceae bacterium]
MTSPPADRIALRVTPDALRQIRGGHPWVYDSSVTSASRDGRCGDLAVVFDDRRRFAAIGLWDPTSPIRLRVLHHGRPLAVDRAFWAARLRAALD